LDESGPRTQRRFRRAQRQIACVGSRVRQPPVCGSAGNQCHPDLYDRFGAHAEFSLQILAAELIQNEEVLTPGRQVRPNQSGIVKRDLASKMGVVQRKPVGGTPREHAAQSRGTSMHVEDFWLKRLQDLTQLPRALQQHFGTLPQVHMHAMPCALSSSRSPPFVNRVTSWPKRRRLMHNVLIRIRYAARTCGCSGLQHSKFGF